MDTGRFRGFETELREPGILLVTFNDPEHLNGMTQALKRDLIETLYQAQMDDGVRVVVMTGSGKAFSAGDDISGKHRSYDGATALAPKIAPGHHNAMGTYDGLRTISQLLNLAVRHLDKLSIAAINGWAIQTGFSLALSCDFRIMSDQARIGSGTLRFGLQPDEGGHHLVVRLLGIGRAMDFFMRNRLVGAEEALALGLVHEVVPQDELLDRTLDLARELAEGPQVAMRLLKRALYNAVEMTFEQALDDIAGKTAISDHHPDTREGVEAFQQKRTPRFNAWLEADR
jgi:2-(1,2-epoxy-1,2-dihydrophenyl)acetyl-CoA isomerase